ncbi:hypothetical protein CMI37_17555 [Candidatus Pacearchaeota archaeon]|nr:hypothetical protein [Candidatus Pacearchaeota archaeon]
MGLKKATVANSCGLQQLAKSSQGRNRSVDEKALSEDIDPEGIHVMSFSMVHNDVELRTEWLVKLKDDTKTKHVREVDGVKFVSVWLDVDFIEFDKWTSTVDVDGTDPVPPATDNAEA